MPGEQRETEEIWLVSALVTTVERLDDAVKYSGWHAVVNGFLMMEGASAVIVLWRELAAGLSTPAM